MKPELAADCSPAFVHPVVPKPMRTLLFSTLYPSSVRPGHGIFVETRLRKLLDTGHVATKVVAPVPWFPSTNQRFGEYARLARTPFSEAWHGVEVHHPRYPLVPKLGMSSAPFMLAAASLPLIRRLLRNGFTFDLIDAHYYYPDGVAAVILGQWLRKPVIITARGTDLNLIPRHVVPRRLICWAAQRAQASIGVSAALIEVLRSMGIASDRLHVMRNGVDLDRFRPLPRDEQRRALGLGGSPTLLSVGHLVERKGHHVTIDSLPGILMRHPGAQLVIVGEGPERQALERHAEGLGLARHVRFAGSVPQAELAAWYSAADLSVLASSREGWANVLLESMACGTPVVATCIWGTPEVVTEPCAGELVLDRTGTAIGQGVIALLERLPSRQHVRTYAERFGWGPTTAAQLSLFEAVILGRSGAVNSSHA